MDIVGLCDSVISIETVPHSEDIICQAIRERREEQSRGKFSDLELTDRQLMFPRLLM